MPFSIFALIPVLVTLTFSGALQTSQRNDSKSQTVLRVTTRLVEASVIVQDGNGRPVTGLKKDDFILLVGGKERAIDAFAEERASVPEAPEEPLPPGVYSNELTRQPGIPNSLTAILFDALNTTFWDQVSAGQNLIGFLGQIKPQDRIAILTLGSRLRVLHDFSSDTGSLVRAIRAYQTRQNSEIAASMVESYQSGNPVLDAILEKQIAAVAKYEEGERIRRTLEAMTNIADYMATIPGRKNLIWISGSFRFPFGDDVEGVRGVTTEEIMKACRAVSNANMALYPVDARGLVGPADIFPMFNAANRGGSSRFMAERVLAANSDFYRTIQTMQTLAERTGGRAFYNTNDITNSIRRAVDDSADHYMLGFYPREDEWNSKFHNIKVKVNRPGLEVRYRQGFYSSPGPQLSAKDRAALAMEAVQGPLEATRLTLMVRLDPPSSAEDPLRFELVVDPHQIALEPGNNPVTGRLYIAFVQRTDAGKVLQARQETVDLRLSEATYRSALEHGLALPREWALDPAARQLRIAVCDGLSDNVGSITVSLFKKAEEQK